MITSKYLFSLVNWTVCLVCQIKYLIDFVLLFSFTTFGTWKFCCPVYLTFFSNIVNVAGLVLNSKNDFSNKTISANFILNQPGFGLVCFGLKFWIKDLPSKHWREIMTMFVCPFVSMMSMIIILFRANSLSTPILRIRKALHICSEDKFSLHYYQWVFF